MHLTIIFGAMLSALIGLRVAALLLLIALKTIADALAHVNERRKHAARADVVPVQPAPS